MAQSEKEVHIMKTSPQLTREEETDEDSEYYEEDENDYMQPREEREVKLKVQIVGNEIKLVGGLDLEFSGHENDLSDIEREEREMALEADDDTQTCIDGLLSLSNRCIVTNNAMVSSMQAHTDTVLEDSSVTVAYPAPTSSILPVTGQNVASSMKQDTNEANEVIYSTSAVENTDKLDICNLSARRQEHGFYNTLIDNQSFFPTTQTKYMDSVQIKVDEKISNEYTILKMALLQSRIKDISTVPPFVNNNTSESVINSQTQCMLKANDIYDKCNPFSNNKDVIGPLVNDHLNDINHSKNHWHFQCDACGDCFESRIILCTHVREKCTFHVEPDSIQNVEDDYIGENPSLSNFDMFSDGDQEPEQTDVADCFELTNTSDPKDETIIPVSIEQICRTDNVIVAKNVKKPTVVSRKRFSKRKNIKKKKKNIFTKLEQTESFIACNPSGDISVRKDKLISNHTPSGHSGIRIIKTDTTNSADKKNKRKETNKEVISSETTTWGLKPDKSKPSSTRKSQIVKNGLSQSRKIDIKEIKIENEIIVHCRRSTRKKGNQLQNIENNDVKESNLLAVSVRSNATSLKKQSSVRKTRRTHNQSDIDNCRNMDGKIYESCSNDNDFVKFQTSKTKSVTMEKKSSVVKCKQRIKNNNEEVSEISETLMIESKTDKVTDSKETKSEKSGSPRKRKNVNIEDLVIDTKSAVDMLSCDSIKNDKAITDESYNVSSVNVKKDKLDVVDAIKIQSQCTLADSHKHQEEMSPHVKSKKKRSIPKKGSYKCDKCQKVFSLRKYLNQHMMTHNPVKKYFCDRCDKGFAQCTALKVHVRSHTGERPYKCPKCPKGFTQNINLVQHLKIHTGEKTHRCEECGKVFAQASNYKQHLKCHSDDKPCICEMCGKTFSRPLYLRRHMIMHTGERPYVCEHCNKTFTQMTNLKQHLRVHTGEKPFQCTKCGKCFSTASIMKKHIACNCPHKSVVSVSVTGEDNMSHMAVAVRAQKPKKKKKRKAKIYTEMVPVKQQKREDELNEVAAFHPQFAAHGYNDGYVQNCYSDEQISSSAEYHGYSTSDQNLAPQSVYTTFPAGQMYGNIINEQQLNNVIQQNHSVIGVPPSHIKSQYGDTILQSPVTSGIIPTTSSICHNSNVSSSQQIITQPVIQENHRHETYMLIQSDYGNNTSVVEGAEEQQSGIGGAEENIYMFEDTLHPGTTVVIVGDSAEVQTNIISSDSMQGGQNCTVEQPLLQEGQVNMESSDKVKVLLECVNMITDQTQSSVMTIGAPKMKSDPSIMIHPKSENPVLLTHDDFLVKQEHHQHININDTTTTLLPVYTTISTVVTESQISAETNVNDIIINKDDSKLTQNKIIERLDEDNDDGDDNIDNNDEYNDIEKEHNIAIDSSGNADSEAREEGSTVIADSSKAREKGSTVIADSSKAREEGSIVIADSSKAREKGRTVIADSSKAREEGSTVIADSSKAREEGRTVIADSSKAREEGRTVIADSSKAREEGSTVIADVKEADCDRIKQVQKNSNDFVVVKSESQSGRRLRSHKTPELKLKAKSNRKNTRKIKPISKSESKKPVKPVLINIKKEKKDEDEYDHPDITEIKKPKKRSIPKKGLYLCDECGKGFTLSKYLLQHLKTHTGLRPYQCGECDKTFTQITALKFHIRSHTGEKPFECEVCHKTFAQNNNLKQHSKVHTGDRPYCCQYCLKSFSQLSNWKQHLKTHLDEKEYKCRECGRKFNQHLYLKRHLIKHTGERPYECDVCKKTFTQATNLKMHKRTHTGEKPFMCQCCGKNFTTNSNLKQHFRRYCGSSRVKVVGDTVTKKVVKEIKMAVAQETDNFKTLQQESNMEDVIHYYQQIQPNSKSNTSTHLQLPQSLVAATTTAQLQSPQQLQLSTTAQLQSPHQLQLSTTAQLQSPQQLQLSTTAQLQSPQQLQLSAYAPHEMGQLPAAPLAPVKLNIREDCKIMGYNNVITIPMQGTTSTLTLLQPSENQKTLENVQQRIADQMLVSMQSVENVTNYVNSNVNVDAGSVVSNSNLCPVQWQ